MLYCSPNCPKKFKAQSGRGLSGHRKSCPGYEQHILKARQTRQSVASKRKEKLNRRHVTQDVESADMGGPSSIPMDLDPPSIPEPVPRSPSPPMLLSPQPIPQPSPPPPPLPVTSTGRPRREYRMPARYQDILPVAPVPATVEVAEVVPEPFHRRLVLIVRNRFQTAMNTFGLWRDYLYRPSYDPDVFVASEDLYITHNHSLSATTSKSLPDADMAHAEHPPESLHKSTSEELLIEWQNTGGSMKSNAEMNRLVHDVLQHPDFCADDLHGFNAQQANRRADEADKQSPHLDMFLETSVSIEVPSGNKDIPSRTFEVPGLMYRKLLSVIKAAFSQPLSEKFHLSPYKLFHQPLSGEQEHVYSELYDSDAFIDEHDQVQRAELPPDNPNCKRERVVAALMFWSDATHLTNFGTAKLWPLYMLFGNLSKYIRAQPNSGAVEHIAYIPPLPDSILADISKFHQKWGTQKKDILTHLRRELMHSVWQFLLDDEFVHAYKYGIVIRCHDGIERRIYPRIFTYSADYPEKVLLATSRDKGLCPCPRCLMPKAQIDRMGLVNDIKFHTANPRQWLSYAVTRAREFIYKMALPIAGAAVDGLLKATSSVPTLNAFVVRLGENFNVSNMLVVDLLHEFELGIWKALFTHLIWVLFAAAPDGRLVTELDRRFRNIPTFGSSTIRRFANNASEMKKLAARDFEDLLQCAIPAFEGLLPEPHNSHIMKLLYRTAEWHALAKLRMHTDPTLQHFEVLTKEFGQLMRQFQDLTAQDFETYELPREADARTRRATKKAMASVTTTPAFPTPLFAGTNEPSSAVCAATAPPAIPLTSLTTAGSTPSPTTIPSAVPEKQLRRKKKTLNLNMYKWHALGDYPRTIRMFGTTDSYSTQVVSRQIAKHVHRIENARRACEVRKLRTQAHGNIGEMDPDTTSKNMDLRYTISHSKNRPINIFSRLRGNPDDPAYHLRDHILGRLLQREFDGDTHEEFTDEDRNHVRIVGNKLYEVGTCRINYTTYDVRREENCINPRSHADIMLHSPETESGAHPYWYARVIGIFHATVLCLHLQVVNHTPQHIELLWVRWFGIEPGYRSGIRQARLPKVGFVESSDDFAFGFLDPAQVIRGRHMIPAFDNGRTSDLLPLDATAARVKGENDDWTNYYVRIFVDRDMFMRFRGGGVGHRRHKLTVHVDDDHDEDLEIETESYHLAPDNGMDVNEDEDEDTDSGDTTDDEDTNEDDDGYGIPDMSSPTTTQVLSGKPNSPALASSAQTNLTASKGVRERVMPMRYREDDNDNKENYPPNIETQIASQPSSQSSTASLPNDDSRKRKFAQLDDMEELLKKLRVEIENSRLEAKALHAELMKEKNENRKLRWTISSAATILIERDRKA
ncbi:hypothetical protein H0H81_000543 [Sphagnurus paluster]|uniref:Uncharacterized protein n=1 Tax=Sphagnurus paluster TaxID=117069 RepID=A0A9P7K1X0_9AGAR|nr:hypothetical protein H0H81_000543 [Sphagnurus paluster]